VKCGSGRGHETGLYDEDAASTCAGGWPCHVRAGIALLAPFVWSRDASADGSEASYCHFVHGQRGSDGVGFPLLHRALCVRGAAP
jgi:hypothetical protein